MIKGGVLIDRAQADLVEFGIAKYPASGRDGLNVTSERVEATNGHIAVTLKHDGMNGAEFPGAEERSFDKPVLLSKEVIKAALKATEQKATIPVLGRIRVSEAPDDRARVEATDLEGKYEVIVARNDSYPNLDQVMPKADDTQIVVGLSAEYLGMLAKWARAHGGHNRMVILRFSAKPKDAAVKPVRIEVPTDDGRKLEGALMPIRVPV